MGKQYDEQGDPWPPADAPVVRMTGFTECNGKLGILREDVEGGFLVVETVDGVEEYLCLPEELEPLNELARLTIQAMEYRMWDICAVSPVYSEQVKKLQEDLAAIDIDISVECVATFPEVGQRVLADLLSKIKKAEGGP